MDVDSLNTSRGHDGSKPRGTFYENLAMENERFVLSYLRSIHTQHQRLHLRSFHFGLQNTFARGQGMIIKLVLNNIYRMPIDFRELTTQTEKNVYFTV